jgi:hypothetical protein
VRKTIAWSGVFKRFAARLVTSPFAFFVSWTIDLAILIRAVRRQRTGSV